MAGAERTGAITAVTTTPRRLHLLVAESEPAAGRARHAAALRTLGRDYEAGYAGVLRRLAGDLDAETCCPADDGATLPGGAGLADYDGVVFTGSALNISDGPAPAIARQIALMRAALDAGLPVFGSCFGIQLAAAAAGGTVRRNPKGREFGILKGAVLTAAGAGHPLMAGRRDGFAALSIHGDEVGTCPPDTTVLAGNAMSAVQAAEIRSGAGVFWGVQYHPEFTLADMAVIAARLAPKLAAEGHFPDVAAVEAWAAAMAALDADPGRSDLAAAHGIPQEVLSARARGREILNWLDHQVRPYAARRSRA
jgi:GMP synthase (glutamine-hydrolysing)